MKSWQVVYEYGRHGNPTRNHLEHYFAQLEGSKYGTLVRNPRFQIFHRTNNVSRKVIKNNVNCCIYYSALAFGSGVAGLGAVILSLNQGDHIVSSIALYGGSTCLLRQAAKYGITTDFFETTQTDEIVKKIKANTKVRKNKTSSAINNSRKNWYLTKFRFLKLVFLESPSNPDLRLLDIAEISRKVHEVNPNILVAVDNTFLTPVLQNCLQLGADLVLYSTSKYIGGHADIIGGMVTMNCPKLFKNIKQSQEGSNRTDHSKFSTYTQKNVGWLICK